MEIKFSDIEEDLKIIIQNKLKDSPIPNEDSFSLIKGFMSYPSYDYISNTNHREINDEIIMTVGILGHTSGRIYNFSLNYIMPNIDI